MELASARDWIIIILGVLEILIVIGIIIVFAILYIKISHLIKQVNRLVAKGKDTIERLEHAVTSPYLKASAWLFRIIADGFGLFKKRKMEEDRSMEERISGGNGANFWLGMAVGLAIGAGVSLLYAPKPGSEMRAAIKEKARDIGEKTSETYNKAKSKMAEMRGRAEEKAEALKSQAENI